MTTFDFEKLVRWSIEHPSQRTGPLRPRWAIVRDMFGFGSTTARELCRHFGADPDELIPAICQESDEEE